MSGKCRAYLPITVGPAACRAPDLPHARRSACPHAVRNCESDGPSARDGSSATVRHGRTGRAPSGLGSSGSPCQHAAALQCGFRQACGAAAVARPAPRPSSCSSPCHPSTPAGDDHPIPCIAASDPRCDPSILGVRAGGDRRSPHFAAQSCDDTNGHHTFCFAPEVVGISESLEVSVSVGEPASLGPYKRWRLYCAAERGKSRGTRTARSGEADHAHNHGHKALQNKTLMPAHTTLSLRSASLGPSAPRSRTAPSRLPRRTSCPPPG